MNFDPNDPRLTAYALGEPLDADAENFVREHRDDPDFQAAVEEIRQTAKLLETAFAAEADSATAVDEKAILERAKPTPPNRVMLFLRSSPVMAIAATFVLMGLVGVISWWSLQTDDYSSTATIQILRDDPKILRDSDVIRDGVVRYNLGREEAPTVNGIKKPVAQNIPAPKPPPPNADSREAMLKEVSRSWSRPQIMPAEGSSVSNIQFAPQNGLHPGESWSDSIKPSVPIPEQQWNREGYDLIKDNEFTSPGVEPLSTFSIDVDTASYANVRRMLRGGQLPPPDAVRIEELINYFDYDYPIPDGEGPPFSVTTEVAPAPWSPQHYLVRIGLKGYEMPWEERPSSNLVFLIDVSGSMNNANKLGLVKQALAGLTQRLDRRDRVAIVVYAGSSGLALPSTTADNQETIQHALANLKAGGSTNGGEGIELAYQVAQEKFIEGGNNRVILCTDGDFNVGVSDRGQLTRLIEDKAKSGVFLSICGFGMGNLKDDMMESLSNAGNGNYAYIDTIREARKVFGQDLAGTMLTIAKDVKIQVEFNPTNVAAYRLIGYENRILAAKDFNDDTKDAGEIGAGHTVTALYEIVPTGVDSPALPQDSVDALKYQKTPAATESENAFGDEWLTVKLRYKQPDGDTSTLLSTVVDGPSEAMAASSDLQFASSVVEFGLLLRDSPHAGNANWASLIERARQTIGTDPGGHRAEFVELAKTAQQLSAQRTGE